VAGTNGTAGVSGTAGAIGSGGSIAGATGTAGTGAGGGGATGTAGTSGGRGGAGGTAGTAGGRGGAGGTAGTAGTAGGRGGAGGTAGTAGGRGGAGGTGGATGTAGSTGSGGAAMIDCNAPLPSGGTQRSSSNASGTAAGLTWTIWTNSGPGTITTFSVPAFAGSWNGSGDYLARLGLQWNNTRKYDSYGTITAQFASRKTGSAGQYSYIGVYGWSTNPCVEFYIVDDSFNGPANPGGTTNKGTVTIDGGSYVLYTRNTTGTGGSKCGSSINNWMQFYSMRMQKRACGQISITDHFNAWAAAGMVLGNMDQAQVFVETGGGTGNIEFPVANVTVTTP
jgi:hypothetical protein